MLILFLFQIKAKKGPFPKLGMGRNLHPKLITNLFTQKKSQTAGAAVLPPIISGVPPLKNPWQILRCNTDTGVFDTKGKRFLHINGNASLPGIF